MTVSRTGAVPVAVALLAAAGLAAAGLAFPATALASPLRPGYGPPPLPPAAGRGFRCVVTSQSVRTIGGQVSFSLRELTATLRVRARTFPVTAQITITEPSAPNQDCAGQPLGGADFPGYHPIGGIGVLVQLDGANFRGFYSDPLVLRVHSSSIGRRSFAAVWNGRQFVRDHFSSERGHAVTVRVLINSRFVIMVRNERRPADLTAAAARSGHPAGFAAGALAPPLTSALRGLSSLRA